MEDTLLIVLLLVPSLTVTQDVTVPERRYACWGSFGPPVVSAQCPRDTVIQITRAGLKVQHHGGVCSFSESDCGCNYGEPGCNMPNVRNLCMGRPACRLDVTQQYINTENCRGFSDYMFVEFLCVPVEKNSIKDICSSMTDSGVAGFIRSPSNPVGKSQCQCTLSTSSDSTMAMTILDFRTKDLNCDQNRLNINDNTYCGDRSAVGNQITTDSSKVTLTYDTDGNPESGGFWLKYETKPASPISITCQSEAKAIMRTTPTRRPTTPTPPPRVTPTRARPTRPRRPSTPPPQSLNMEEEELEVKEIIEEDIEEDQMIEKEMNRAEKRENQNHTPWWWKFTLRTRMKQPTTKLQPTTIFPPWFKEVDATEVVEYMESSTTLSTTTTTTPNPPPDNPRPRITKLPSHPLHRSNSRDSGAVLTDQNKIFDDTVNETKDTGKSESMEKNEWRELLPPGLNFQNLPPQLRVHLDENQRINKLENPDSVHVHDKNNSSVVRHSQIEHDPRSSRKVEHTEQVKLHRDESFGKYRGPSSGKKQEAQIYYDTANKEQFLPHSQDRNRHHPNNQNRIYLNNNNELGYFVPVNETYLKNSVHDHDVVYDNSRYDTSKPLAEEVDPELLSEHELFSLFFPQGKHVPRDNLVTPRMGPNEPSSPGQRASQATQGKEIHISSDSKRTLSAFSEDLSLNFPTRSPPEYRIQKSMSDKDIIVQRHNYRQENNKQLMPLYERKQRPRMHGAPPRSYSNVHQIYRNSHRMISKPQISFKRPTVQLRHITRPNDIFHHDTNKMLTSFTDTHTTMSTLETDAFMQKSTTEMLSKSEDFNAWQESLARKSNPVLPNQPLSPSSPSTVSPSPPHVGLHSKEAESSAKSQPKATPVVSSRKHHEGRKMPLAPPGLPYPSDNNNSEPAKESITVTITAACVIGSILLIIIIGIVVRFVINRSDPSHALRQRHKKECALRRQGVQHNKSYA